MADVDRQLFQELKHRYPEIPDGVVTRYMTQVMCTHLSWWNF